MQAAQEAVSTVTDLFEDCDVTISAETETTVTLSLTLTATRLATIVQELADTRFSLETVTYRGPSRPSTLTLTTNTNGDATLGDLQEAAEGAYRGQTDDGHAFTFFGTNNRVEINDFLNTLTRSPYAVQQVSATETPPLCIDLVVA